MKIATFLIVVFFSAFSFAQSSVSFQFGVVGKSCVKEKCLNYSDVFNAKVQMKKQSTDSDILTGKLVHTYEIQGIKFVSTVDVSEFDFHGNHQLNFYMELKDYLNGRVLAASELIVSQASELNTISIYAGPLTYGDITISPKMIIGASIFK